MTKDLASSLSLQLRVSKEAVRRLPELSRPLLEWYSANKRDLPWRGETSPYRVWISEIMLQQTKVEAGRPYYERFIKALPDMASLAAVEEELLFKLWEGLGYYNRARNLQRAAEIVMEQYDGELPGDFDSLLSLPGIGEYTAGAIGSIAFGLAVPAVDGNVLRVLSRLLSCSANVDDQKVKKVYRTLARQMIPDDRPGDFNQTLMELGAVVCLPKAPKCLICPLSGRCLGYQKGNAKDLPVKSKKKAKMQLAYTVIILISQEKVFLQKRPEKGLLPGLWQPLIAEGRLDAHELEEYLASKGVVSAAVTELGESRHIFTHQEWGMTGYLIRHGEAPDIPGGVWVSRENLPGYALPSAFKAYTKCLPDWIGGLPFVKTIPQTEA